jgi:hypothetical protein
MDDFFLASSNPRETRAVVFTHGEDAVSFLSHMRSESRGWNKPMVDLKNDPDSESLEIRDALCMVSSFLIISNRERQAIASLDQSDAIEWIEAECSGKQWWAVHGLVVADAVDEEQSVIRRAASGRVMTIERLTLTASRVPNQCIFRLGNGLETFPPVVTAAFRKTWLAFGLSGLRFSFVTSQ